MEDQKLTAKESIFVMAYLSTGSATEAYRSGGYAVKNMKPATVTKKGYEVLNRPRVQARIRELTAKATTSAILTRTEAMEILTARARVNFFDYVEFGEREIGVDKHGAPITQTTWRIKDCSQLDKNQLVAISKLTAGKRGLTLETHDPLAAIAQLSKMQGWEAAQKFEHGGLGGGPILTRDVSDYSDEELVALLQNGDK